MANHTDKQECKYHHHSFSEWECTNCSISFCNNCVPFGHCALWGVSGPRCIFCNSALDYLGSSVEKRAFWTMLWHFFQYPLHTNSLMMIAFVTLMSFIIPFTGILSIGIMIFLVSVSVKYSFSIIETRAHNVAEPPPFSSILEKDEHYLFLKLIAVMFVLYTAAYVVSGGNETIFEVFNGVITFALPAVTIILAIEKSIMQAINPLNVSSFILRIGWAYLLMWLCYQIVSSGPNVILPALETIIPDFLVFPFIVIIGLYFWFAANCMLGYTVYQYQDVLGHVTVDDEEINIERDVFDRKKSIAEAYILLRENNLTSAKNIIRPMLDRFPEDIELHDFYHKILLMENDKTLIQDHADFYIAMLMRKKDEQKAATVYQDVLAKLPNYQVRSVEAAYILAQVLEVRGRKKEALKLLTNLHKVNPEHQLVAPAYLMLAKLLSEYQNNDAQAMKVLDFILQKYPTTDIKHQIVEYRKVLQNLNS